MVLTPADLKVLMARPAEDVHDLPAAHTPTVHLEGFKPVADAHIDLEMLPIHAQQSTAHRPAIHQGEHPS